MVLQPKLLRCLSKILQALWTDHGWGQEILSAGLLGHLLVPQGVNMVHVMKMMILEALTLLG